MAKKIQSYIKLQIPAGKANPSPPVGPALGQHGVNIMDFCKAFNAKTRVPVIPNVNVLPRYQKTRLRRSQRLRWLISMPLILSMPCVLLRELPAAAELLLLIDIANFPGIE